MENEIKNAVIESVGFTTERGVLSAWVYLDYGGSVQGFGGHVLYKPNGNLHGQSNFCGHFVYRVLQIAGVDDWAKLKGQNVRVKANHAKVVAIGHTIKNDWFDIEKEFAE